MALGARRASIVASVLRDGFRLAGAGGLVGLLGAFALSHSLRVFVWGIEPTDPVTYVAAIGVLGVATLLASWIPARLAAAVDPSVTLRGE
jgi:ABC-type antimicrobial peptide transport system permease subunit